MGTLHLTEPPAFLPGPSDRCRIEQRWRAWGMPCRVCDTIADDRQLDDYLASPDWTDLEPVEWRCPAHLCDECRGAGELPESYGQPCPVCFGDGWLDPEVAP